MADRVQPSEDFSGTGRFVIKRRLGAGGMGVVYQALDRERNAVVALKLLRNLDDHSLYRFKNEFRALADLVHPNLVRLYELFYEHGQWFFTMEFVEGTPFLRHLWGDLPPPGSDLEADTLRAPPQPRAFRLDPERLRRSFLGLAQGVQALHAADKIHRDIKPSNVLVTADGRVVLLDFGLVTDLRRGRQETDVQAVGTAYYMAPEQAAARPVGPPADWYAVGSMLYEALTGVRPFEGSAIEILAQKQMREAAAPRARVPSIPGDLDELCQKLLRMDPAQRPEAAQVFEALRAAAGETPSASGRPAAPFVGRQDELAALDRAFAKSREGRAVVALVRGESGLGKSALVRHFTETLVGRAPELLVFAARCYERESLPYKAFDSIVDGLTRHLSRIDQALAGHLLPEDATLLARVFPVLRRVPAMRQVIEPQRDLPDPHEVRARAFAALRRLLARLADRWPIVLFIDDLQWADADSVALLGDVMVPHDAPKLMLVATARSGETSPLAQSLGSLLTSLGTEMLDLAPLSRDEAQTLAGMLLGGGDDAARAQLIADEARGHPLFIQELARYAGIEHTEGPTQLRLEEALWARISRLDKPAREVLELVAIAGAPMPLGVLTRATRAEPESVAQHVLALRTEQLVRATGTRHDDTVDSFHDRIRESVVARVDEKRQREHHSRLAEALEISGLADQDPQILVRHLEAAGDAVRAARHAERAARVAAHALAFDRAAELLRKALELGHHDEAATRALRIEAGDALVNAGRGAEAAELYLLAADGADGMTRLECERRAAEQLLSAGHIERGMRALAAVLAEVGVELPATPRRALMSVVLHRGLLRLRGLRWKSKEPGSVAPRNLLRVDIYKAVGVGLGMVDTLRGADFQVRGLLAALRTGDRIRIARSITLEGAYLGSQGGRAIDRAWKLLAEAEAIAKESRDPYLLAWTAAGTGIVSYFAGLYGQALARLSEGEQLFRERTNGTAWELTSTRLFWLFSLRNMGAYRQLRALLEQYLREAARRDNRYAATTMSRGCNIAWLAEGRPDHARAELERRLWSPPEGGFHLQHWYELRANVELDLYQGNAAASLERLQGGFDGVERSLLSRVQSVHDETLWMRARLALVMGDVGTSSRLAAKLLRSRMPYARVWGRLVSAAVWTQKQRPETATAELRKAVAEAEKSEMFSCAAAARSRLAQLVPAERELAEAVDRWMAAEEIAEPPRMLEIIAPGFVT